MQTANSKKRGMTLVELIVSMSITMLVIAGVISSTLLFAKITKSHESMAEFQSDIRIGLQEMSFDIQNATRVSSRSNTAFTLVYSDGSTISYRLSGDEIIRTASGASKVLFRDVTSFDVLSNSSDSNDTLTYSSDELAIELIQLQNSNSIAPDTEVRLENFVYKLRNT